MISSKLCEAVTVVRQGGIIAYPTENCFGLGCLPRDYHAVKRILSIKHRVSSKGLILVASDISQLLPYIKLKNSILLNKMTSVWPSATTWLAPAADWVPAWLRGNSDKIAVRVPAHRLTRRLCQLCCSVLVSTSANKSGCSPCRSVKQIKDIFGDSVDYTVRSGCGGLARPSVIIDLISERVMRN